MKKGDDITLTIIDGVRVSSLPAAWAGQLATCSVIFGAGILADSPALQWAGFVAWTLLLLIALVKATGKRVTVDEAQDEINRLRKVRDESLARQKTGPRDDK